MVSCLSLAVSLFASQAVGVSDSAVVAPTPVAVDKESVRDTVKSSYDRYGKWQVGFSGGVSTGGGLAVRYWWNERNGVEVHGFASLTRENYPEDDDGSHGGHYYGSSDTGTVRQGELSLGVHYLHQVFRSNLLEGKGTVRSTLQLRGLTFVGAGVYSYYEDRKIRTERYQNEYDPATGYYKGGSYAPYLDESHEEQRELLGGAGGGLELEVSRLSVHLMFGYGGGYSLSSSSYGLGPTVDGGIFVRF